MSSELAALCVLITACVTSGCSSTRKSAPTPSLTQQVEPTQMKTVSDVLADPQFRGVVDELGRAEPPLKTYPSAPNTKPERAPLSDVEAVHVAKWVAEQHGVRLSDYKDPEACREFRSWWVFFVGRVPVPGNHFVILIDDQTGDTRFIPGE